MGEDVNGRTPVMIRAERVHKDYRLGELSSLGITLRRMTRRLGVSHRPAFAALDDISFEVSAGESFGIVGRNGSGKSTLLHMICGITLPTSGTIRVRGRLLPLL